MLPRHTATLSLVVAVMACQLACSLALQNGLTCEDLFVERDTTVLLVAGL